MQELTVNVEEGQESQQFVAFASWSSCGLQFTSLRGFDHHRVGDNVAVGQHDTLGMTCGSTGVDQECKVLRWIASLCSPPLGRSGCIDDTGEVLDLVRRILRVAHHDHPVKRNANLLCRFLRILDER